MWYFFMPQGVLHPLHAWSGPARQGTKLNWYGVEDTNIQKVPYLFPGRGEVPTLLMTLDRLAYGLGCAL